MLHKSPKFKILKRKTKKGKLKKNIFIEDSFIFGNVALVSASNSFLTLNEIEALRKLLIRKLRDLNKGNKFKLLFRIFPHKMLTMKSKGSRMGKGKGSLDAWVCPVKKGQFILEINGFFFNKKILRFLIEKLCSKKLNINLSVKFRD